MNWVWMYKIFIMLGSKCTLHQNGMWPSLEAIAMATTDSLCWLKFLTQIFFPPPPPKFSSENVHLVPQRRLRSCPGEPFSPISTHPHHHHPSLPCHPITHARTLDKLHPFLRPYPLARSGGQPKETEEIFQFFSLVFREFGVLFHAARSQVPSRFHWPVGPGLVPMSGPRDSRDVGGANYAPNAEWVGRCIKCHVKAV